jgi:hypothetical protein
MRFMVLVKASKESERGDMPDPKMLTEMQKFNEELIKAGVVLDLSGLKASSHGARIKQSGAERTVVDGPFTETKELIAGYWLVQMKSLEECVQWFKRCPNTMVGGGELEIRTVWELNEFELTPEQKAKFDEMNAELLKKK